MIVPTLGFAAIAALVAMATSADAADEAPAMATPSPDASATAQPQTAAPDAAEAPSVASPVSLPPPEAVPAPAAAPIAPATPRRPVAERIWYTDQMTFLYLPSLVLISVGAGTNNDLATAGGLAAILLVPPVFHLGHGNVGGALGSVGLRVLLLVTLVHLADSCLQSSPDGSTSRSNSLSCGAFTGAAVLESLALPIYDLVMASTIVERPVPRRRFAVLPQAVSGAFSLSLAGRF